MRSFGTYCSLRSDISGLTFVKRPSRVLKHLDVKGIANDFPIYKLQAVAGRKSIEQRCFAFNPALHRYVCYLGVQFGKTAFLPIDGTYTKYVQSLLSQGAGLVETDHINLTTYVDSIRRDAKDRALAKPIDGKCRADG